MIDLSNNLGGGGYAVASHDLEAALGADFDRISNNEAAGGMLAISELASHTLNISAESVYRRLNNVRTGRQRSVNAELAEAVTLAVGNWFLSDLDIPTLPRCIAAAVESVEAWVETWEPEEEVDVLGLARSLTHFANGYVSTFEDVEALIAAEKEQDADAELVAA